MKTIHADEPTGLLVDRTGFSLPPGGTLREIWAGVDFAVRDEPVAANFVKELQNLYGEVVAATFEVPAAPAIRWYLARGRPAEIKFFDRFWRTPSVRAALPGLEIDARFRCREPFELISTFCLGGEFATAVYMGGCYGKFKGSAAEAREIGEGGRYEFIGDRYDDFYVYRNHHRWCAGLEGWVCAWTWLIVDLRAAQIHVLYTADVD